MKFTDWIEKEADEDTIDLLYDTYNCLFTRNEVWNLLTYWEVEFTPREVDDWFNRFAATLED